MLKLMLRLFVLLGAAALALLVTTPVANAAERDTFFVPLTSECTAAADSGATGYAIIRIDAETGEVRYRVVAFNLPGTVTAAHIHGPVDPLIGPNAPPVVNLDLLGLNSGVVVVGTVTDPDAPGILLDPAAFYINVHTDVCPGGALRGSLG